MNNFNDLRSSSGDDLYRNFDLEADSLDDLYLNQNSPLNMFSPLGSPYYVTSNILNISSNLNLECERLLNPTSMPHNLLCSDKSLSEEIDQFQGEVNNNLNPLLEKTNSNFSDSEALFDPKHQSSPEDRPFYFVQNLLMQEEIRTSPFVLGDLHLETEEDFEERAFTMNLPIQRPGIWKSPERYLKNDAITKRILTLVIHFIKGKFLYLTRLAFPRDTYKISNIPAGLKKPDLTSLQHLFSRRISKIYSVDGQTDLRIYFEGKIDPRNLLELPHVDALISFTNMTFISVYEDMFVEDFNRIYNAYEQDNNYMPLNRWEEKCLQVLARASGKELVLLRGNVNSLAEHVRDHRPNKRKVAFNRKPGKRLYRPGSGRRRT